MSTFLSGDDPGTTDKYEGGSILNYAGTTGGGIDWNPCPIMFNFDRTYWTGPLNGHGAINVNDRGNFSPMNNAWFFQAGDYYKGTSDLNQVANDYMVINKLTLTF